MSCKEQKTLREKRLKGKKVRYICFLHCLKNISWVLNSGFKIGNQNYIKTWFATLASKRRCTAWSRNSDETKPWQHSCLCRHLPEQWLLPPSPGVLPGKNALWSHWGTVCTIRRNSSWNFHSGKLNCTLNCVINYFFKGFVSFITSSQSTNSSWGYQRWEHCHW